MRKQIISLILAFLLLVGVMPLNVSATQINSNRIDFEDGSYMIITIEDIGTRATNTRSGNKYVTYYDGSDNVEWEAKLYASFTYDGTTSTCTSANCTVTIYENAWYEYSNSTTRSGNTATTELVMGQRLLGITIAKREYTITLTCDKDGNLS